MAKKHNNDKNKSNDNISIPNLTIQGGAQNDNLSGGSGKDYIEGNGGNDTIHGNKGADELYGNGGDDVIYGGAGNDTIGGDNAAFFSGTFVTGGGPKNNNVIYGGAGNDHIRTENGDDKIDGGQGNDFIGAGLGSDKIDGGAGNDTIYAGGHRTFGNANTMKHDVDTVFGGKGDDTFVFVGVEKRTGQFSTDKVGGFGTVIIKDFKHGDTLDVEWFNTNFKKLDIDVKHGDTIIHVGNNDTDSTIILKNFTDIKASDFDF